jgi:hypothetical protein
MIAIESFPFVKEYDENQRFVRAPGEGCYKKNDWRLKSELENLKIILMPHFWPWLSYLDTSNSC